MRPHKSGRALSVSPSGCQLPLKGGPRGDGEKPGPHKARAKKGTQTKPSASGFVWERTSIGTSELWPQAEAKDVEIARTMTWLYSVKSFAGKG